MQPVAGLVFIYFPGVAQPIDASDFQAPGPINSGIWDIICQQNAAESLVPAIKAFTAGSNPSTKVSSPVTINGVGVVANDAQCPWKFISIDPSIHVWQYEVNLTYNGAVYTPVFMAADILNRQQYPNPFEDGSGGGPIGGPVLALTLEDNTAIGGSVNFDLRWTQAPPQVPVAPAPTAPTSPVEGGLP